ncbi:hypothetical protein [Streptomyces sp. NPDC046805]|uniref:hypothetical protein n=1 Tax=Streptomyces sp. NPDC046805 TaxID=3155134 RepID=UPI0033F95685
MIGMGGLREMSAPFVVPGPAGVAVRDRLKCLAGDPDVAQDAFVVVEIDHDQLATGHFVLAVHDDLP